MDSEEEAFQKIMTAFPKLKEAGGIELMTCMPNSTDLLCQTPQYPQKI